MYSYPEGFILAVGAGAAELDWELRFGRHASAANGVPAQGGKGGHRGWCCRCCPHLVWWFAGPARFVAFAKVAGFANAARFAREIALRKKVVRGVW